MAKAVYPGSFDPVHKGHVDIATRAARVFDVLHVGIYETPPKNLNFRLGHFPDAHPHENAPTLTKKKTNSTPQAVFDVELSWSDFSKIAFSGRYVR